MKLLALETASGVASAAVYEDGKLKSEVYLDNKLTHSATIMPMAERVLAQADLLAEDMDYFAVDVGPGSFTGVRIGVCAANAMAAACGKYVIPVDSLTALAANLPYAGFVCALLDARADRIYAALFDTANGFPEIIGNLFAGTIDEWLKLLPFDKRIVFVGDGAAVQRGKIVQSMGEKAVFAPFHLCRARASSILIVASRTAELKKVKEAMPLYLRPPQADRLKCNG